MTPLRQQMIEAMRQRGFSVRTHKSYLAAVIELSRYFGRSPARLNTAELQRYFVHLAQERELAPASCRLQLNAVRFLYLQVLKWPEFDVPLVVPKRPQKIPELLTREDVGQILAACSNAKHRMLLEVCYGCGLRVSEVVRLQVRDMDRERHLLRVCQGKGAKDRLVLVSAALLADLRRYWRAYRPSPWFFPSCRAPQTHVSISTAQKVFGQAKARSCVNKMGGIHSLRHAYASHQLEQGMAVHQLQRLLGHNDLHSTMRYLHWVPGQRPGDGEAADLIARLEGGHG